MTSEHRYPWELFNPVPDVTEWDRSGQLVRRAIEVMARRLVGMSPDGKYGAPVPADFVLPDYVQYEARVLYALCIQGGQAVKCNSRWYIVDEDSVLVTELPAYYVSVLEKGQVE